LIRNILEAGLDKQSLLFDEEQDQSEQLPDRIGVNISKSFCKGICSILIAFTSSLVSLLLISIALSTLINFLFFKYSILRK
jgi:hypothetical protein